MELPLSSDAPKILAGPEDLFKVNGNDAVFRCEVFAFPNHDVYWTYDDNSSIIVSTLDPDSVKYFIILDRGNAMDFGQLTVTNVQYEDRGTYNCNARNLIGGDSANATLTVHGELSVVAGCCMQI